MPSPQSLQIILPIISILFLLYAFIKPIYGTIAYMIIMNAKLGELYPILGKIRFELVAAIMVFAAIAIHIDKWRNLSPTRNKINLFFYLLFLVGMLSVPQAVDVQESWQLGGYNLLKMALFYIMIVTSVDDVHDLKKLVWAFILITLWISYEPIFNFFTGKVEEQTYGAIAYGTVGVATGHVALANTLSQAAAIPIFLAMVYKNKMVKFILIAISIVLVMGVILTKSRGGFIGLLTIGILTVVFSNNRKKAFVYFLLITLLVLPLVNKQYVERISTITQGVNASRSASDRFLGLVNGIDMFVKRPILGVGIGCYAKARWYYFGYYFFSHNLYGELLGELGMASIIWFLFIYFVYKEVNFIRKNAVLDEDNDLGFYFKALASGIIISLTVRLVLGNFSHCAFIWFWFFMAAVGSRLRDLALENSVLPPEEEDSDSQDNL